MKQYELNIAMHTKNLSVVDGLIKLTHQLSHNNGNRKFDTCLSELNQKILHLKSIINEDLKHEVFNQYQDNYMKENTTERVLAEVLFGDLKK